MKFVLASGSPRRRELLDSLGLAFTVDVSDVEEFPEAGEAVQEYVQRLARDKGASVAVRHPDAWIIAADTVVYIDDTILEKPQSATDAARMLGKIAGRQHIVYTGVALLHDATGYFAIEVDESHVNMLALTPEEIAWYVGTGEPMDKAGSYAVQGIGAMFIESIDGSYTNVVGLPLARLFAMMKKAGIDVLASLKI